MSKIQEIIDELIEYLSLEKCDLNIRNYNHALKIIRRIEKELSKDTKCVGCEGADGKIKNIPDSECLLCTNNNISTDTNNCDCPQGSLCDFFCDNNEGCMYGEK